MIKCVLQRVLCLPNWIINCVYANPPCQLSLWEETGAPGENPRLSAESLPRIFTLRDLSESKRGRVGWEKYGGGSLF